MTTISHLPLVVISGAADVSDTTSAVEVLVVVTEKITQFINNYCTKNELRKGQCNQQKEIYYM